MASATYDEDDGVDHISGLSDDLLLHILRFLSDDARDVVCTSVLSRRWSNLWTRAPVLRIGNWDRDGHIRKPDDDTRFQDFLHNLLARRAYAGADAQVDMLEVQCWCWPGKSRADVWLRRAMRLAVTSLVFEVWRWRPRGKRTRRRMMTSRHLNNKLRPRHSLPATTRVATLSLDLNHATLLLPRAVQFHSLTELTLCQIWFAADDGPRLSHLLSSPSCCPRLRKLKLSHLSGLHHLRLHGRALETLKLKSLGDVRRLDLDAPRLSTLSVGSYFMHYHDEDDETITIRAPALEELVASLALGFIQLELQSRTIELLQQCRPLHGHRLCLQVPETLWEREEDELMTEIPKLPDVTNLTIRFSSNNSHYLGEIVSSLLARCSNLEYLHLDNLIHLHYDYRCEEGCGDCVVRGSWKNDVISLEHLHDVKLGGFSGREQCCLDMVQLLLASAPALERMILTAKASIENQWLPKLMLTESLESCLPRGKGKWAAHRAANVLLTSEYEWMPDSETLATGARDESIY